MNRILLLAKKQWFTIGLVAVIVLGVLFPDAASLNIGGRLTTAIVALVFLGMGITLPSEVLINGLSKWRIHLFIQSFIFILIPGFFFISTWFFKGSISREIHIGLLALAVLPTTISTCSVFTLLSRGDVVLTLFNASLSNILGIVISPLLLSFFLREAGRVMPLSMLVEIITGLALIMLLPLAIGQVVRLAFRQRAKKLEKKIGITSNLMILSIVFFTLSKSASTPIFRQGFSSYLIPIVYLIMVHFILIIVAVVLARKLQFSGPETISVMYAAPQKTLAMGVPLLSAYFADDPTLLGIVLLPLLFYHPWQLFIAGILKSLPIVKSLGMTQESA